jgi:hypothetical protein
MWFQVRSSNLGCNNKELIVMSVFSATRNAKPET